MRLSYSVELVIDLERSAFEYLTAWINGKNIEL
jgi:hypothetical protein